MNTTNEDNAPDSDESKAGLCLVLAFLIGLPILGILVKVIGDWMGK
jgi:hypothetical protein